MARETLTRREFFVAALLAPSVLAACSNRPTPTIDTPSTAALATAEPTQPENAKILEREIEERFEISLDVVDNGYSVQHSRIPKPYYWSTEHLNLLAVCFPHVPKHFYAPDNQLGILTISLGKQSSLGERPREAILNHFNDFTPSNKRRAFETLIHELVHTQDPMYTVNPPRIVHGVEVARWSPWYDRVEEKLGLPFADFSSGLKNEISTKVNILQQKVDNRTATVAERQQFEFYRSFQYSLGLTRNNIGQTFVPIPTEFVTVLSESYVHGEAFFKQRFSEFLSLQQCESMYTFVKDDIFKGYEYEKFPL